MSKETMGRAPCCEKIGLKKGKWTTEEDEILANYIKAHGEGSWRSLPKKAGLLRCGKSCRLRWINYLRAGLKRGNFSREEDELIIKLHATLGNRWSQIARDLPGRTDNEIKNYWNSNLGRSIHSYHVIRDSITETESVESLKNSQTKSRKNNEKMARPTKKIRKKEMVVEEVIIPQTSLKHCNESVHNEFSSLIDEALRNSNNDAFSRPFSPTLFDNSEYWSEPIKSPTEYSCTTDEPCPSKEEIINGPGSPDLNSIFKEIDDLLNSEIEETNVAHGGDNNMPGDTDAQNGSLVPKDAEGHFGDMDCPDFLWDLDIWSSVRSIEDELLQHIIV